MAKDKKKYDFSAFDEHPSQKYDFNAFDAASGSTSPEEGSSLQAAAEGAATGATASLKPIIGGASQTAMDVATGNVPISDILERYRQYRDKEKVSQDKLQQESPMAFGAGSVAGSIIPAIASGGASEALSGPAALEQAALTGAKYGAVQGLGESKADITKGELGQALDDTAKGGVTGAITAGALQKMIGSLQKAPEALENLAANRAIAAQGGTKGEFKNLIKQDRFTQHGKNLLEKNEYGETPLVTPFSRPDVILDRATALKEKSGQAIGDILSELDSNGVKDTFFNPKDVVDQLEGMKSRFTKNGVIRRSTEGQYNELEKVIDDIKQYGEKPISFNDANEIKQLVSDLAYDDKGTLTNQLMGEVRGKVNDAIETAADAATQNNPELSQKYLKAKEIYGTAKTAERMALGSTAAQLKNRDLGITDYLAGGAVAATHGGPAGIAAAVGSKLGKSYGNATLASGSKALADTMGKINKVLVNNPASLKSIGTKLSASPDQLHQTLGRVLSEASTKDDVGRNALIFSLMQNDKYREIMRDLMSPGESEPTGK